MNTIAQPFAPAHADTPPKIGGMLLKRGKITGDDVKAIAAVQREQDLRFGDAAVSLGLIDAEDVRAVLAEQFAYNLPGENTSGFSRNLFTLFQPETAQAEAIRSLRSELLLRYFDKTLHGSLALVGAEDDAGIAHTAANLAVAFAQLGLKTLLVDANLRNPQLYKIFGLSERISGLSDLIAARAATAPLAIPGLNSLWMLASGTRAPNPQELLASQQCSERLLLLSQGYDVTLISTSPISTSPKKGALDAQLVAARTGAALLVVKENVSRLGEIEAICRSLRSLGVEIPGAALQR